jgi:hypothetical protein
MHSVTVEFHKIPMTTKYSFLSLITPSQQSQDYVLKAPTK